MLNSSVGKESACNAEDPCLIPGSGRSTGEGIGYPLQYSGLENSIDCIVHWVTKSPIRLSNFHNRFLKALRSQQIIRQNTQVQVIMFSSPGHFWTPILMIEMP